MCLEVEAAGLDVLEEEADAPFAPPTMDVATIGATTFFLCDFLGGTGVVNVPLEVDEADALVVEMVVVEEGSCDDFD